MDSLKPQMLIFKIDLIFKKKKDFTLKSVVICEEGSTLDVLLLIFICFYFRRPRAEPDKVFYKFNISYTLFILIGLHMP